MTRFHANHIRILVVAKVSNFSCLIHPWIPNHWEINRKKQRLEKTGAKLCWRKYEEAAAINTYFIWRNNRWYVFFFIDLREPLGPRFSSQPRSCEHLFHSEYFRCQILPETMFTCHDDWGWNQGPPAWHRSVFFHNATESATQCTQEGLVESYIEICWISKEGMAEEHRRKKFRRA